MRQSIRLMKQTEQKKSLPDRLFRKSGRNRRQTEDLRNAGSPNCPFRRPVYYRTENGRHPDGILVSGRNELDARALGTKAEYGLPHAVSRYDLILKKQRA